MLTYNPAQDCYHTVFRFLQILEEYKQVPLDLDKIRILDFYLLFPAELSRLTYPKSQISYKFEFKKRFNPYGSIRNAGRIFHQLEPLQTVALYSLASRKLLDQELLRKNRLVLRTEAPIEEHLANAIRQRTLQMGNLVHFLTHELAEMSLNGPGGLKDRSGLLEHKYDILPSEPIS